VVGALVLGRRLRRVSPQRLMIADNLVRAVFLGAVPVAWVEEASHTTWENAVYTAKLLRSAGIRTVVLVSQAWHLPRAMVAFERAGLAALPWVGARTQWRHGDIDDFLPNLSALEDTKSALHEMIGAAYYDFGIKKGGGWRGG